MRQKQGVARPAGIAALAVVFTLLLPVTSSGATLARVRNQLRAWHLRPAPLFPSRLPASFRGASATLDRSGVDFNVDWSKDTRSDENYFLVSFRRGNAALLTTVLHDTLVISVRRVRIGTRSVYSIETGRASAPSLLAWHEQGRTYLLIERYVGERAALRTLSPFVQHLRILR